MNLPPCYWVSRPGDSASTGPLPSGLYLVVFLRLQRHHAANTDGGVRACRSGMTAPHTAACSSKQLSVTVHRMQRNRRSNSCGLISTKSCVGNGSVGCSNTMSGRRLSSQPSRRASDASGSVCSETRLRPAFTSGGFSPGRGWPSVF